MQVQWLGMDVSGPGPAAVLVRVSDGRGHAGVGEVAAETGSWTAAEAGQVRALLAGCGARLADVGADSLNHALDAAAEVTASDPLVGAAVLAGLDVALHDLAGRLRGVPLAEVLGGRYRSTVEISRRALASELAQGPAAVGRQAMRVAYRAGPPREATSHAPESDLARLAALLADVDDRVQVDIEAIVPFDSPAQARTFAESLLGPAPRISLGLLQPLHEADLLGHAALRATLPVPIILGRSVRSAANMSQIVRLGAADRIVLAVERVGGLREAMQVVALAEAASIGVAAASAGRTAIGVAAALALAAALHDTFPAVVDSLDQGRLAGGIEGLGMSDGRAELPAGPGLGLVLPTTLERAFTNVL